MWLEGWETGSKTKGTHGIVAGPSIACSLPTDLPDSFSPNCFAQETNQTENEHQIGKSDVLHDFCLRCPYVVNVSFSSAAFLVGRFDTLM